MSAIALLNHELTLKGLEDFEVCVSLTGADDLELWQRSTGDCLEQFEDEAEAGFFISTFNG
jgi:hypothetical protein